MQRIAGGISSVAVKTGLFVLLAASGTVAVARGAVVYAGGAWDAGDRGATC
jgi:hypothetical protein